MLIVLLAAAISCPLAVPWNESSGGYAACDCWSSSQEFLCPLCIPGSTNLEGLITEQFSVYRCWEQELRLEVQLLSIYILLSSPCKCDLKEYSLGFLPVSLVRFRETCYITTLNRAGLWNSFLTTKLSSKLRQVHYSAGLRITRFCAYVREVQLFDTYGICWTHLCSYHSHLVALYKLWP